MSLATRMCKVMCEIGIRLVAAAAIGGCSDEPASDKGALIAPADGPTRPVSEAAAADNDKPISVAADGGASAGRAAGSELHGGAGGAAGSAAEGGGNAAPPAIGSAGAQSGGGESSGAYTFSRCPDAMPPSASFDVGDLTTCDGSIQCGGSSHCIPIDRLKMRVSEAVIERTPDCSAGKCLPDEIVQTGKIRFTTCTGDLGEGRCIPQCFALWVMPLSAIFERGAFGCGSEEVLRAVHKPGHWRVVWRV